MRSTHFLPPLLFSTFLSLATSPALADEPPKPAPAAAPPAAPVLVPPRPLAALEAAYPTEPGLTGEADVVLDVTVAADGSVKEARIVSGDAPFTEAASRAAPGWRFEPATRNGQPIPARIRVLVHFTPPEPPAEEEAPPAAENGAAPKDGAPGNKPTPKPPGPAPIEVLALGERRAVGTSSLGRAEVRVLPGAFGDPFRAIESLPGVTPIFSGLPFFYIRGAPPGNVGYFLDNVRVPYLYHLALGPSVVNPAIVDRVDLYPGGYPAQFGRFAGGIVAGETTKPKGELHGEANIRIFDAGAMVETPIGDRATVMAGGRFSYTAAALSLLAPDTTLNYWDYQARATFDVTPTDRLTLFAFGAHDYLGATEDGVEQGLFDVQFHRIDLRYDKDVSPRTRLRQAVSFGYDRTAVGGQEGIFARDFLFSARSQLLHRRSESVLLRAGVDANFDYYDLVTGSDDEEGRNLQAALDQLFPPRQDIAVGFYADAVLEAGRGIEFTPGARLDLWGSGGVTAISADVRLAMKVPIVPRLKLVSAMGLAHQPPGFVLPLPGLSIGKLAGGLQRSVQTSTGLDVKLPFGFEATGTFFLNGFFNMADALDSVGRANNGGGGGGPPGPGGGPGGPGGPEPEPNDDDEGSDLLTDRSLGTAVGLELYIRRKLTERLGGYISYTLSRSSRSIGFSSGPAQFDRTHVLNGAISWDAGKGWRLGSRVVFYTGLPIAAADAAIWGKSRTDPFFRIDARIEKRWNLTKRGWVSLVIEMLNATLSTEQTGVSCGPTECEAQEIGPVTVPSIGVEGGL
ncbi:TonB family protein [Polyangium sp. 6x1]|uniref:TonB family protein n=1 Tax=Polyangium sp. 6x1 TaxID=3042689 RepID=UPI0024830F80|nr:TonB family protein [Polyangium sp. 6x1]MDI1444538.1 TonB family protein [Polyangium sp. 6x1]